MRTRRSIACRGLSGLALAALLAAPGGPLAPWLAVARAAPAAQPLPEDADGGWPRRYRAPDGAAVVLYEPQIASWDRQLLLTLHAAVAYTPKAGETTLLGTIVVEADTRVSVERRLVDFSSFRITQSHFQSASKDEGAAVASAIKGSIPLGERVIALDRVLAHVDASRIAPRRNVDGVKADPPLVFFSTGPAVIVNIDGDPIWSPIESNDLRFAVNTNWDLFEHPPSKTFYLRHQRLWLQAAIVGGPWTAAKRLPASFSRLPADENWKEVRASVPLRDAPQVVPRVFVSTVPAELILLRGAPEYEPVAGTRLMWVRNTEADLFRMGADGTVYYLVSGRWFSSPGFDGPWTFATPTLPADFATIPLEHERSRVLASVPGTVQAAEAVLLAQVPERARVSKTAVKPPEVSYQGEPRFEPIEPTSIARATNTEKDVFHIGGSYYMCFQGVWFVADAPSGPWRVTGSVPDVIYDIPVSSSSHHVTYVTVEDDDDEWVVFATAAAYTGMMVAWGCAVWGTGYYYPPYVWYGGYYPAYFPHYPTYGYSAWYNPWTGSYGRAAAVYGPYGGAGVAARYNPRTGTYARGAAAYGPYGARAAAGAYNPRTGTSAATRQGSSVYGSWGSTGVRRGDRWATTSRVTSHLTGTTTRVSRTSEGGGAVSRRGPQGGGAIGVTGDGDVYAGRDGSVYRRQGDSWQKFDNGEWTGVQGTARQSQEGGARVQDRAGTGARTGTDTATFGQLQRDATARNDGAQRTRSAATARSGSSSAATYRPSSGAARAGGSRSRGGRR